MNQALIIRAGAKLKLAMNGDFRFYSQLNAPMPARTSVYNPIIQNNNCTRELQFIHLSLKLPYKFSKNPPLPGIIYCTQLRLFHSPLSRKPIFVHCIYACTLHLSRTIKTPRARAKRRRNRKSQTHSIRRPAISGHTHIHTRVRLRERERECASTVIWELCPGVR